jgi:surface antigen
MKHRNHHLVSLNAAVLLWAGTAHAQYPTPNLAGSAYTTGPFARHTSPLLVGQCTWYAYGRIQEAGLISATTLASKGIFLGNASTWPADATRAGYSVGSEPRQGAIAVWTTGKGHLAFVEQVVSGRPEFSECNATPMNGWDAVVCRDDQDQGGWKVRLRSTPSIPPSGDNTKGFLPKYNVFSVVDGPVSANGYYWYHLNGNGYDGWADFLEVDTGNAANPTDPNREFSWSFTRVKLQPSSSSIAMSGSPDTFIYLSSATVPVTIDSAETGRSFALDDGTRHTAPETFDWVPGSSHTVTWDSPQAGTAGVQHVFAAWNDGPSASARTIQTPSSATTYKGLFNKQFYLTMTAGTGGTVKPNSGWYAPDTPVSISAVPDAAHSFGGWTGVGNGSYSGASLTATVTMGGPVNETASFGGAIPVTIDSAETGRSFALDDGTRHTAPETFNWVPGSSRTVTWDSPQAGTAGVQYVFAAWNDGPSANSRTIQTPSSATTYKGLFNKQFYLTMTAGTGGTVNPTSGWYAPDTSVSISAVPDASHSFGGWTGTGEGSYSGGNAAATATMRGPITEVAAFTPVGPATIINGQTITGSLTAPKQTNVYTFTAAVGEQVLLRLAVTDAGNGFSPRMSVYAPDGSRISDASDAFNPTITLAPGTPARGPYSVHVRDYNGPGTGAYKLKLLKFPDAPADQGDIANGQTKTATLGYGEMQVFNFTAAVGEQVLLRLAVTDAGNGFSPRMSVYAPDGSRISDASDAFNPTITLAPGTPARGPYSVLVRDYNGPGTGAYKLKLLKFPDAAADQGDIANGQTKTATLGYGEMQVFNFTAAVGEQVLLRLAVTDAANGFSPRMSVYAPDGSRISDASDAFNSTITLAPGTPARGPYSVLVRDYNGPGTGAYKLKLLKFPDAPADQGEIANGQTKTATLGYGEMQVFNFTAGVGEQILLRLAVTDAVNGFSPRMSVYAPDGSRISDASDAFNSTITLAPGTPARGPYSVLVRDYRGPGTGAYKLKLLKFPDAPADQGEIANGQTKTATLGYGHMQVFNFTAGVGQQVLLRLVVTDAGNGFYPRMSVYNPSGSRISDNWASSTIILQPNIQTGGTNSVLVRDYNGPGTGSYKLELLKFPGAPADHGELVSGQSTNAALGFGDMHVFTFNAAAGDNFLLKLAVSERDTAGFQPSVAVYGPDGRFLRSDSGSSTAEVDSSAPTSGTYWVLVKDSAAATGSYRLRLAKFPGAQLADPKTGELFPNQVWNARLELGDMDVFSFNASAGDAVTLNLRVTVRDTADYLPWMGVYAPDGKLLTWNYNSSAITLNPSTGRDGTYWVLVGDYRSGIGSYSLTLTGELHYVAPTNVSLQPLERVVVAGRDATFTVTATGTALLYQWRKDGVNLVEGGRFGGTRGATMRIAGVVPGDTGAYSLVVSNARGSVTSSNAALTVDPATHFVWEPVASPQAVGVPFTVTIRAVDAASNTVSGFAGTVALTANAVQEPTVLFGEGFEDGNYDGWDVGSGSYTRQVTTDTAAGGSQSLTLIGGAQVPLNGISHALPNLTPDRITFYVRLSSASAAGGYFVVGDGDSSDWAVFFFANFNWDGTMGLYDGAQWHGTSFVPNRWYKITLELDWSGKQVDYYVDDVLVEGSIPFRASSVSALDRLHLYNWDNTQAWWDEVTFWRSGQSTALALGPSVSGSFVNGAWTGEVTLQGFGTNVILQAEDAVARLGISDPFEVTSPPVISVQPISQALVAGGTANLGVVVGGTPPFGYQWRKDGVNLEDGERLDGVHTSNLSIANVVTNDAGSYSIFVSNAHGSVTSSNAVLSVAPVLTLALALDTPDWVWTTGGSTSWAAETNLTHDGFAAAVSGAIGSNQETWIQTTVTRPGTVGFWWKVSSERDYDFLEFFVGNARQTSISGDTGWVYLSNRVAVGPQVLRWRYAKDANTTRGLDRGWVDEVVFIPDPPELPVILSQTGSQTVVAGGTASFTVSATGADPLAYQWRKDGVSLTDGGRLSGTASPTLTVSNLVGADAGNYSVRVSNGAGATNSTDAALTVVTFDLAVAATNSAPLVWTPGSWLAQAGVSHDGVAAVQSGPTADNQASKMQTTVSGPGRLTFWWKVSSENGYDYLRFLVNGVEQKSITDEVDWRLETYTLPAGSQTLRWSYTKDETGSAGRDAGWVDEVAFVPIAGSPLTVVSWTAAGFTLQLPSSVGARYTLQFKRALSDSAWTDMPPVIGDGSVMTLTDLTATDPARFYRVRLE